MLRWTCSCTGKQCVPIKWALIYDISLNRPAPEAIQTKVSDDIIKMAKVMNASSQSQAIHWRKSRRVPMNSRRCHKQSDPRFDFDKYDFKIFTHLLLLFIPSSVIEYNNENWPKTKQFHRFRRSKTWNCWRFNGDVWQSQDQWQNSIKCKNF